jgi:phage baseplate assembly protein V
MMNRLMNAMRAQAALASSGRASVRLGIVSSYDHANYCAKVRVQPEDTETGWLPVTSPWIGNGWGMFVPPTPGDLVEVQFQEDSFEAGFVVGRFYNDSDRPLDVPSGEFWLVHKGGSLLKFHNDGTVELHANKAINSSAPVWNHTGPVNINGDVAITGNETVSKNITATLDIYDRDGTKGTLQHVRDNYDVHTHSGVVAGGDNTGMPNNTL